eukprot:TRINITY_DN22313_c0_g1_i1.p1 TRINITY_DN22313_c0_g1~~TRINITY_DN22313_c0_g1_i1.p1  ORF type:complete len:287 (-),score=35.83 TRINITY_DN22313_c0_g1_i1:17-811(-)
MASLSARALLVLLAARFGSFTAHRRSLAAPSQQQLRASKKNASSPSIFCFVVAKPGTYEVNLMRAQFEKGVGIFACDEWAVLSSERIEGLETTMLHLITDSGSADNTRTFIAAWNLLTSPSYVDRLLRHEWIVKVDPDSAFVPSRLKTMLPEEDKPMYLHLPTYQIFGAVEPFSRGAVKAFATGSQRCEKEINYSGMAEDTYVTECMKLLKVDGVDCPQLLGEYTGDPAQPEKCNADWVAFHPLKGVQVLFECLKRMTPRSATC